VPPSAISWGKASIKQWRNEGKTHQRRLASKALQGSAVGAGFLGARPKVWLSDRLPARCTHTEAHQFFAHLIRYARYAIDHGDMIFAPQFKAFLKDACAVGCRRPDLADSTVEAHRAA
jgi:transposase